MISRRLIRIKVLQVLYAFYSSEDKSVNKSEKELFQSIQKTHELYHLLFLLLVEILKYAEDRIDAAKNKKLPTYEDLHPNTRFIENKVLNQLRRNKALDKFIRENKISWAGHDALVKKLYNTLKEEAFYKKYMEAPSTNYRTDRSVVVQLITHVIAREPLFHQTIEDMSIYWNNDFEHVANMVIKTMDGMKESDGEDKELMPLFKNEDDRDFAKNLFRKALLNKDYFNQLIEKHAENWELERIAFMDILIMHLAMAEMMEFESIPVKVTLNEYIEIAKEYSTEKSGIFVNGILDKAVVTMKNEGKIHKTGRGLIET